MTKQQWIALCAARLLRNWAWMDAGHAAYIAGLLYPKARKQDPEYAAEREFPTTPTNHNQPNK